MDEFTLWKKYYSKNNYYHSVNLNFLKKVIEKDASVIEFGSRGGELLRKLPNTKKVGVNISDSFKVKNKKLKIILYKDINKLNSKYDYILINHALSEVADIQLFLSQIKKLMHEDSVIIVASFNYSWKPLADVAETLRLKYPYPKNPNWLDRKDIDNFFSLENFVSVTSSKQTLIPYEIPLVSGFINKYLAPLPLINNFCITQYLIYKPRRNNRDYSISIVIPARNEEGNIKGVLNKIPSMGKSIEVIFVEGHSKDNTKEAILKEIGSYKGKNKAFFFSQKGTGKGDAVRMGFSKAKGEVLMILDADLTVDPKELPKFYRAISEGHGDIISGSRFVYPMENQAMRTLNYIGNNIFSIIFSYLLGQTIKDTLCGTKVLFKKHYNKIESGRKFFGDFDPFGDFDLIFGAKKINLKIIEIPVRYKDRVYGKTNISTFTHGWLLLKMSLTAAKIFKFS